VTRALVLVALLPAVAFAQPAEPEPAEPSQPAAPAPAAAAEPASEPAASEPAEPEPTLPAVPEPEPKRRTPFDQGRFSLTAGAGTSSALGQRYFGIGAGAMYFALDGVGIGLGTQVQWGDGPTILRTTPELRYVAQPLVGRWPLIPYAGVFYTHWFIGDAFIDVDAVGTRGGLLYVSGSVVLGLGVAYEHLVSECDAMTMDCSSVYPDITISVAL
jgi:hypothetical protein